MVTVEKLAGALQEGIQGTVVEARRDEDALRVVTRELRPEDRSFLARVGLIDKTRPPGPVTIWTSTDTLAHLLARARWLLGREGPPQPPSRKPQAAPAETRTVRL